MQTSPSDEMQTSPSDGMQASPSGGMWAPPPSDEASLLKLGDDTGEHIHARLPWTNADRLFQTTSGAPGREGARKCGK